MSDSDDRTGSGADAADGGGPTVIVENDRRAEIGAFVLGAVIGAGLALLFAPGSGEETQRRLRRQARKLKALTRDRMRDLQGDVSERMESAKGVLMQGRDLAAEARRELEDKLARSKAAYRADADGAAQFDEEPGLGDAPGGLDDATDDGARR